MNLMRKLLSFFFIALVAVIVLELAYYLVNSAKNKFSTSTKQEEKITVLKNTPFKIIYQEENDSEGRTILYDALKSDQKQFGFTGSGEMNDLFTPNVIGLFDKWEAIPNSKDQYIYLIDPVLKKTFKNQVVYEASSLLLPETKKTMFGVENLDDPGKVEKKSGNFVDTISSDQLSSLIRKGDAIIVFLAKDTRGKLIKNSNKLGVAQWVVIRRFGGIKTLL